MAYDKNSLLVEIRKLLAENDKVFFFADIYDWLGMHHDTFYRTFPKGSEIYNEINETIRKNRSKDRLKNRARLEMLANDNVGAAIAVAKVTATNKEFMRLANTTQNQQPKKENPDTPPTINVILGNGVNIPTPENNTPQPKKTGKKGKNGK